MNGASSESRNATTAAISSAVPIRPTGSREDAASRKAGSNRSNNAVSTGPGATAFTRTPLAAFSIAAARVSAMMAALVEP
jgi:hypothetical protein